jgi:hypothetical protein
LKNVGQTTASLFSNCQVRRENVAFGANVRWSNQTLRFAAQTCSFSNGHRLLLLKSLENQRTIWMSAATPPYRNMQRAVPVHMSGVCRDTSSSRAKSAVSKRFPQISADQAHRFRDS